MTDWKSKTLRDIVGLGSLLACAGPVWHLVLCIQVQMIFGVGNVYDWRWNEAWHEDINVSNHMIRFARLYCEHSYTVWTFLLCSTLGYLLLMNFCLLRWSIVAHKEGVLASVIVVLVVLAIGLTGALATVGLFSMKTSWGESVSLFLVVITSSAEFSLYLGFWMLWGFLLACGLRKLRRMRQEANAE